MERLQKRELSRQLAQATHISIGDAEKFVTEFFATLADGLKQEGEVEVYGFGAFRKENNDEGGEKEHSQKDSENSDKKHAASEVTYAPAPQMADAVNWPFVNFQPVVVTADVEPDEIINQQEESTEDSCEAEKAENPESGEKEEGETSKEPENSKPQSLENSKEPEPSNPQTLEASEPSAPLSAPEENLSEPSAKPRNFTKLWLSLLTLVIIVIVGYLAVQYSAEQSRLRAETDKADSIRLAKQDSLRKDSIRLANLSDEEREVLEAKKRAAEEERELQKVRKLVGEGVPGAPEYPCSQTLAGARSLMPLSAYTIAGTQRTVVVEKGQSLKDIANIYGLQQGEFIIQVHNGIESVKEGQRIRIPLLKRK